MSLASPAGAQDLKQQWAWCLNKDTAFTADQWMAGCTAVIDANRETPENRAIAFRGRGNAYVGKGQPERAIQDYDQALRLDARASPRPITSVARPGRGTNPRASAYRLEGYGKPNEPS